MLNGLEIDQFGNKRWYKDDMYHRENGPAVERADGFKEWYLNDKRHRVDGPAIEDIDGSKKWFYKGIFVGEGDQPDTALWARLTSVEANGGPLLNGCVVDLFGNKRWYKDDVLHREAGPAVEDALSVMSWFFHGKYLDYGDKGFWRLWDLLTDEQRSNPNLLKWMPR